MPVRLAIAGFVNEMRQSRGAQITVGPSINIFIKLMAVISLVLAPIFMR